MQTSRIHLSLAEHEAYGRESSIPAPVLGRNPRGGNGRIELPHASDPVANFQSEISFFDAACNWLALHPRWTCALLCAGFILAGQADSRWLP